MRRILFGSVFVVACAVGERHPEERAGQSPSEVDPVPEVTLRGEGDGTRDSCGRIESLRFDGGTLFYSLPCRKYDRARDLPRPLP